MVRIAIVDFYSRLLKLTYNTGAFGSDGWVRYRVDLADAPNESNKPVVRVHFACPTGNNDNEFGVSSTVRDGSNASSYLFAYSNTDYPKRDHPLTGSLSMLPSWHQRARTNILTFHAPQLL